MVDYATRETVVEEHAAYDVTTDSWSTATLVERLAGLDQAFNTQGVERCEALRHMALARSTPSKQVVLGGACLEDAC